MKRARAPLREVEYATRRSMHRPRAIAYRRAVTFPEAAAILATGMAAGAINAIVGAGSLITFPTLLALGYPPLVANVSNTVGLVPGSLTGALGYRRELAGQRRRMIRLGTVAILGGLTGGTLLLALPPTTFERHRPVPDPPGRGARRGAAAARRRHGTSASGRSRSTSCRCPSASTWWASTAATSARRRA